MKGWIKMMNAQGLTLIDIIIAVTILSLMMISVVSVTNDSLDHKEIIISEDRELLQIETAFDRLNWDFSQIYTPLYHTRAFRIDPRDRKESSKKLRNFQRNPLYGEGGTRRFIKPDFWGRPIPMIQQDGKEAIEFYTKGHRRRFENIKESEFAWVRYEFRSYQGEDQSKKDLLELVRYYSPINIYDSDLNLKELQATVLTNKVSEYTFFFWNEKGEKWEEDLNHIDNHRHPLRGLKLEIKWKRGREQVEEFSSKTYRTIWPRFLPKNLNKIKYQKIAPSPIGRPAER